MAAALRWRGFEVLTATDGDRGLALLLDHLLALDVLVADLDLPGRDGASLLRLVRVAGGERELPIVIRGGGLSPDDRAALRALGADAVVTPADGPARIAAIAAEAAGTRAPAAPGLGAPPSTRRSTSGEEPEAMAAGTLRRAAGAPWSLALAGV
jgi:DNA-binding response OmpR family regulator